MRDPSNADDTRLRFLLAWMLSGIAFFGLTDLLLDQPESFWDLHAGVEGIFFGLSFGSAAYLWAGWIRTRHRLGRTLASLDLNREERDLWKLRSEKFVRGIREEIEAQFNRWELSPAERETALWLLRGYGHKKIAEILQKSERTVRQQAIAVYRKSGLHGRAELSAFFLEGLLAMKPVKTDSARR